MKKQEFMEKLRLALSGRVSAEIVTENIRYYEEYINIEVRKGRSEEEVLEQLGDPRLIARTIVQTHGSSGKGRAADESGNTRVFSERNTGSYGEEPGEPGRKRFFNFRIPGWLIAIAMFIIFTAIFVLVLAVVFSVMSVILPVLLIILAVSFLVKLFRDWLN